MRRSVLARRGVGAAQYRIPALTRTSGGRLLAVYDARPDVDDLPSAIDLVGRASADGGATWGPQRVIRSGVGIQGYGDASLVGDDGVGRVLLFHQATTTRGFFEDSPSVDPGDDSMAHIDLAISDDQGETWHFRRLTDQLRAADADGAFAASGSGCVVRYGRFAGRLVQPIVERRGRSIVARIAWSDDRGDSWSLGEPIDGANESAVTDLPDGTLLLSGRARPRRLTGWSVDGGATWEVAPDPVLRDPSDNGDVLALESGEVVCSHNDDEDLRRRLVVHRSLDGGRTWPLVALVEPDSAAYSTMAELPNGNVGLLFERAGYQEIVFAELEEADFEPATQEYLLGPLEVDLVLRLVRSRPLPLAAAVATIDIKEREGWDPATWRETGAARSGESVQPIHPRDAYRSPPCPGFRAGDTLQFTARVRGSGEGIRWQLLVGGQAVQTGGADTLAPDAPLVLTLHVAVEDDTLEPLVVTLDVQASVNGVERSASATTVASPA